VFEKGMRDDHGKKISLQVPLHQLKFLLIGLPIAGKKLVVVNDNCKAKRIAAKRSYKQAPKVN